MASKFLNLSTDNTLGGASASDVIVPSQKAVKDYVDNQGGAAAIDNSTITKNSSNELQAEAVLNMNSASGTTNPLYQWQGTLAEYTAQNIEVLHPDWVCIVTDDSATIAWGDVTGTISNQTDLSNALSAKYDASNPNGYQANVIETVKVNGAALTPVSKAVDITVPAAQVNSDWNANSGVAQILNKPTIPTVNNATLTITQGGTTKGTFTANATSDVTIALDAGGAWGGITGTLSNQTDLQNALNAKADVDLGNINNIGTSKGASWAMPSGTSVALTMGASGTDYTAPANGYFGANVQWQNQASYLSMNNQYVVGYCQTGSGGAAVGLTFVPVKKGDVVNISYNAISVNWFRFTYADGSESEAN